MKRTVTLLLMIACLLSVLAGCGGKKELEPVAFVQELISGAKFSDSLSELDGAIVPMIYEGVDPADYDSVLAYAGTGATAEEIAVFTAVDSAAADRLKAAAEAHVAARIESFKNYGTASIGPDNAMVERAGNHVIVVICSDSAGAKTIINQYV